jgi:predicted ferric reductase
MSFWAFSQAHPFVPVWWSYEADGTAVVEFLVQRKEGFTRHLASAASTNIRALVEGPYGCEKDFGSYGTVLMFATNFGIAAQLPYLKRLIEDFRARKVVTRRLRVYWQVQEAVEKAIGQCVKEWMTELLAGDSSLPNKSECELMEDEVDRLAVSPPVDKQCTG